MEAEVTAKVQAQKSDLTDSRAAYRSSYRVRRFDTRMGMIYLFYSKSHKRRLCALFRHWEFTFGNGTLANHTRNLHPWRFNAKDQEANKYIKPFSIRS